MELKNKIIISFLFLILLILFFNINNVFASVDFSYNNTDYSYADFPTSYSGQQLNYWLGAYSTTDRCFYFFGSSRPMVLKYAGSSIADYFIISDDGDIQNDNTGARVRCFKYNGSSYSFQMGTSNRMFYCNDYVAVYSNYDVYKYDTSNVNSTLFFQQPVPEPEPEVEPEIPEEPEEIQLEGTLAPIVAEIPETKEILLEIVEILPTIIVILISLIALRKALHLLETFLRTS